jgi:hypothetical protein
LSGTLVLAGRAVGGHQETPDAACQTRVFHAHACRTGSRRRSSRRRAPDCHAGSARPLASQDTGGTDIAPSGRASDPVHALHGRSERVCRPLPLENRARHLRYRRARAPCSRSRAASRGSGRPGRRRVLRAGLGPRSRACGPGGLSEHSADCELGHASGAPLRTRDDDSALSRDGGRRRAGRATALRRTDLHERPRYARCHFRAVRAPDRRPRNPDERHGRACSFLA